MPDGCIISACVLLTFALRSVTAIPCKGSWVKVLPGKNEKRYAFDGELFNCTLGTCARPPLPGRLTHFPIRPLGDLLNLRCVGGGKFAFPAPRVGKQEFRRRRTTPSPAKRRKGAGRSVRAGGRGRRDHPQGRRAHLGEDRPYGADCRQWPGGPRKTDRSRRGLGTHGREMPVMDGVEATRRIRDGAAGEGQGGAHLGHDGLRHDRRPGKILSCWHGRLPVKASGPGGTGGATNQQIILVDHSDKEQAPDGIDQCFLVVVTKAA